MSASSKLALGTVQFGLPYGVANVSGQVDAIAVARILEAANRAGIDTLDTAIAYGESETCLGKAGVNGWKIITKLPAGTDECSNINTWVRDEVHRSLSRLNISRLDGLLLHSPGKLLEPNGGALWKALQSLKDEGLVRKIGFSIYDPVELDELLTYFQPDLVQAPYNLLDRRLDESSMLQRLSKANIEVHVRSVFLQGLLLMEAGQRPARFQRWNELWTEWDRWLGEQKLGPLEACLGFVLENPKIDRVIVGVDSLLQLEEIISSVKSKAQDYPSFFPAQDPKLINPSNWDNL